MEMTRIVAMLPVRSMPASVAFYEKLGFETEKRRDDWGWAMLRCGGCRIMVDQSIDVHRSSPKTGVLYLYVSDVAEYHARLRGNAVDVALPETTFYDMQEFRLEDPDGNRLWIGQDTTI